VFRQQSERLNNPWLPNRRRIEQVNRELIFSKLEIKHLNIQTILIFFSGTREGN
jgi:hypothetical protein